MRSSRWLGTTLAVVLAGFAAPRASEASNLSPWVQTSPPSAHISVLDPLRDRLIMFDEARETGVVKAWSLATSTASTIAVGGTAPGFGAIQFAAYDAPLDRVIVITSSWFDGTALWSFNLSGTPSWRLTRLGWDSRISGGCAFDTKRRRVILMAGTSIGGALSSVAAYSVDTGVRELITTTGLRSAARWGHSLIYDSRRDRLIAFGGWNRPSNDDRIPAVLLSDVWELSLADPATWRQITGLEPRALHTAIYDSLGDRMVVFGGQNAAREPVKTLWGLNLGSPRPSLPSQGPNTRMAHSAIYDARGNRMIVHGGYRDRDGSSPLGDIWSFSFDRLDWSDLTAGQIGPGHSQGQALLDPASGEPTFISLDHTRATERWRLGPDNRWRSDSLGLGPPVNSTAIVDVARGRYLFFGGITGNGPTSELWEFKDGWRQIVSNWEPEPRFLHSAVYDPIGERLIVYGGYATVGSEPNRPVRPSAWALSLRGVPEWSALPGLSGRAGHVAVWDTRRNRMIVFGGEKSFYDPLPETWTYGTREGWVQLDPSGEIPPSSPNMIETAVYDSVRDEMVLLAGGGTIYRLALGVPHWRREDPPVKHGLGGFALIDIAQNRAIAQGGSWVETWTLELGCPAVEFEPAALTDGVLGLPYRARVTTGATTGTLTIAQGALPDGLVWNAATGEISGVPIVTGTFVFTLSLVTAKECAYQREYALVVRPCIAPTVAQACAGAATPGRVTFAITRRDSIPIRRWTARVELHPGIALATSCDEASGCPAVRAGDFFGARPQALRAVMLPDGTLEVSGSVDDPDCGARAEHATLFSIDLLATAPDVSGTVRILDGAFEQCAGPIVPAGVCGVTVVTGPGPASRDLEFEVAQAEGDGADAGLTPLRLTFTVPSDARRVEVYRAGFGNYPEYDDSVLAAPRGNAPAAPTYPPGAPWVRTAVASSPGVDLPPVRDFWYYVAFAIDSCENASRVSEVSAAVPNYRLGDVAGAGGDCVGDGRLDAVDLDLLARHYGATLASPGPDPRACLDIGPTPTGDARGRPLTDDRIDFEDLLVLAFAASSSPRPVAEERPLAASNKAWLEVPGDARVGETFVATLHARGAGTVRGARFRVEYDAGALEWVGLASGELLGRQLGPAMALSPRAGEIDLAVLGANLEGTGELARITFRLRRDGPAEVGLVAVEARGDLNQRVGFESAATEQLPRVAALTGFPNPSPGGVVLRMSLPRAGAVELNVFDVQGRWVRSLLRGNEAAGERVLVWDGRGDDGTAQPPGLYIARLVTPSGVAIARIAVIP